LRYISLLLRVFFNAFLDIDENELSNYEAIGKIHNHLDDDRDGEVDVSESDGVSHIAHHYLLILLAIHRFKKWLPLIFLTKIIILPK
jgi:hypothetical protein